MNTTNELKSAEEWAMELAEKLIPDTMDTEGQTDNRLPYVKAIDIIKQIQLNAYKAGMSEAAGIANEYANDLNKAIEPIIVTDGSYEAQWYVVARNDTAHSIKYARDNKQILE